MEANHKRKESPVSGPISTPAPNGQADEIDPHPPKRQKKSVHWSDSFQDEDKDKETDSSNASSPPPVVDELMCAEDEWPADRVDDRIDDRVDDRVDDRAEAPGNAPAQASVKEDAVIYTEPPASRTPRAAGPDTTAKQLMLSCGAKWRLVRSTSGPGADVPQLVDCVENGKCLRQPPQHLVQTSQQGGVTFAFCVQLAPFPNPPPSLNRIRDALKKYLYVHAPNALKPSDDWNAFTWRNGVLSTTHCRHGHSDFVDVRFRVKANVAAATGPWTIGLLCDPSVILQTCPITNVAARYTKKKKRPQPSSTLKDNEARMHEIMFVHGLRSVKRQHRSSSSSTDKKDDDDDEDLPQVESRSDGLHTLMAAAQRTEKTIDLTDEEPNGVGSYAMPARALSPPSASSTDATLTPAAMASSADASAPSHPPSVVDASIPARAHHPADASAASRPPVSTDASAPSRLPVPVPVLTAVSVPIPIPMRPAAVASSADTLKPSLASASSRAAPAGVAATTPLKSPSHEAIQQVLKKHVYTEIWKQVSRAHKGVPTLPAAIYSGKHLMAEEFARLEAVAASQKDWKPRVVTFRLEFCTCRDVDGYECYVLQLCLPRFRFIPHNMREGIVFNLPKRRVFLRNLCYETLPLIRKDIAAALQLDASTQRKPWGDLSFCFNDGIALPSDVDPAQEPRVYAASDGPVMCIRRLCSAAPVQLSEVSVTASATVTPSVPPALSTPSASSMPPAPPAPLPSLTPPTPLVPLVPPTPSASQKPSASPTPFASLTASTPHVPPTPPALPSPPIPRPLQPLPSPARPLQESSLSPTEWACTRCTYANKRSSPRCEMCATPRGYKSNTRVEKT